MSGTTSSPDSSTTDSEVSSLSESITEVMEILKEITKDFEDLRTRFVTAQCRTAQLIMIDADLRDQSNAVLHKNLLELAITYELVEDGEYRGYAGTLRMADHHAAIRNLPADGTGRQEAVDRFTEKIKEEAQAELYLERERKIRDEANRLLKVLKWSHPLNGPDPTPEEPQDGETAKAPTPTVPVEEGNAEEGSTAVTDDGLVEA